jgi:hypothetical protein
LLKLLQDRKHLGQVGLFPEMVDLAKRDDPLLVDHKNSALTDSGQWVPVAEDSVLDCHISVRKEVAAHGEAQRACLIFLKSNVAVDGINAYAHDLGIQLGKSGDLRIHCRELRSSNRRPIRNQESEDDVFLSAIIAQSQILSLGAQHGLDFKVWSDVSYFRRTHSGDPLIPSSSRKLF